MAIADQVPVQSGFHAKSSGLEVVSGIDLTGKTAVVTGGYSGIGLETVRALLTQGARVIVPVRSPDKAAETMAGLEGDVSTVPLDLGDLASVRACVDAIKGSVTALDLLINNAGIMACPEARVGPGWESQFGINHMGHFALTQGLMEAMQNAEAPRVVALSSTAHKMSDIVWDDIQYANTPYDKWQAYGQAKTANALFANALSRRLKPHGGHAFSVHPGGIMTPLQRHLPKEEMIALGWLGEDGELSEAARGMFKTPEQGCSTTLWAATSPKLDGKAGVYCEDCEIATPTDPDSPYARYLGVNDHACSDESAERLWELSERLLADA